MEDYPDPKYAPRISYLLGQFAQELKAWDEAIEAYESIVRYHGDHSLAADAQYTRYLPGQYLTRHRDVVEKQGRKFAFKGHGLQRISPGSCRQAQENSRERRV